MKTCSCSSAFCLIVAASALQAAELPIAFAQSGQQITLPLRHDKGTQEDGSIALWALGQRWGQPLTAKNGAAELTAPKVRVPVVFQVMAGSRDSRVVSELVVYPGPSARWDKNTQLAALGAPDWFNSWSEAVGLPVKKLKELKPSDGGNWRTPEKPSLLVLGERAGEADFVATSRIAVECHVNVLVLGIDWFRRNETATREMVVSPKEMTGTLADLREQDWALPPAFSERGLCIANRETWIIGPEHPGVEEIRSPLRGTDSLRTVFSYIAWQQQLGRSETADGLFLRLLAATAKGAKGRAPLDGHWGLLYPAVKDIRASEQPVLAAALESEEASHSGEADGAPCRGYVLDLRGKPSPPEEFFSSSFLKRIQARIGTRSQLLILGDDPGLDRWEWLKLDRAAGRSTRPGVIWWRDSCLPPSIESQLRLMRLFTDWNISLRGNSQETNHDDR
jgi:hypothetical protein